MQFGHPKDKIQTSRIAIGVGDTQHRARGNLCHLLEEYTSLELATARSVRVPRPKDRRSAMYPEVTQAQRFNDLIECYGLDGLNRDECDRSNGKAER